MTLLRDRGRFGVKSGGGFYDYSGTTKGAPWSELAGARGAARQPRRRAPTRSSIAACARCTQKARELLDRGIVASKEEGDLAFVYAHRLRDVPRRSVLLRRAAGVVVNRYAGTRRARARRRGAVARRGARHPAAPDERSPRSACSRRSRVREHHWGRRVKLCMLRNARSGLCPEDCHYCSQSAVSTPTIDTYRLMPTERAGRGRDGGGRARRAALLHGDQRPRPERARHRAAQRRRRAAIRPSIPTSRSASRSASWTRTRRASSRRPASAG